MCLGTLYPASPSRQWFAPFPPLAPRPKDYEQFDGLTRLLVGNTNACTFEHTVHKCDFCLDLIGKYVESGYEDHVLLAINDAEVAILVDGRDIARAKIAVLGHHLRCRLRRRQ